MANSLVLEFKPAEELPAEEGLKFAVFKIEHEGRFIDNDWGFAEFVNGEFKSVREDDVTGTVVKWCELPNTKLLF